MNNDLPGTFWAIPGSASTTMDRKDLKAVLLKYDGRIMACGYMWDICSKHIGSGVYRVTLKKSS